MPPSEVPRDSFNHLADRIRMLCRIWELPCPKIIAAASWSVSPECIHVSAPPPERSEDHFARFLFARYMLSLSRSRFAGDVKKSSQRIANIIAGAIGY